MKIKLSNVDAPIQAVGFIFAAATLCFEKRLRGKQRILAFSSVQSYVSKTETGQ